MHTQTFCIHTECVRKQLSGVNIPVIVHWEYTEGHNLVNSDIKLQEPPQGGTSSDSDQLHAVHHGVCLCLDTGVKGDLASAFSSSYLASINQSLVLTLIFNNSVLGTITRRITTQPKGRPDFRPQPHPQQFSPRNHYKFIPQEVA